MITYLTYDEIDDGVIDDIVDSDAMETMVSTLESTYGHSCLVRKLLLQQDINF